MVFVVHICKEFAREVAHSVGAQAVAELLVHRDDGLQCGRIGDVRGVREDGCELPFVTGGVVLELEHGGTVHV